MQNSGGYGGKGRGSGPCSCVCVCACVFERRNQSTHTHTHTYTHTHTECSCRGTERERRLKKRAKFFSSFAAVPPPSPPRKRRRTATVAAAVSPASAARTARVCAQRSPPRKGTDPLFQRLFSLVFSFSFCFGGALRLPCRSFSPSRFDPRSLPQPPCGLSLSWAFSLRRQRIAPAAASLSARPPRVPASPLLLLPGPRPFCAPGEAQAKARPGSSAAAVHLRPGSSAQWRRCPSSSVSRAVPPFIVLSSVPFFSYQRRTPAVVSCVPLRPPRLLSMLATFPHPTPSPHRLT